MNIDQIRKNLDRDNIMEISRKTGIHSNTLYRLKSGKNATISTIEALDAHYKKDTWCEVVADIMLSSNGFLMRNAASKPNRKQIIEYISKVDLTIVRESDAYDIATAIETGKYPFDTIEALARLINGAINK